MIVKFHARGKGGGSGPVDYLLGRERNREGVKEAMMQHRKDVLKLAGNTGMMLLGMVLFLFTVSGGTL
ncbi:hypothetical protein NEN32_26405, partial [Escherichia coli]|nr:hypothetical protein [Escherichia coli]MEB7221984.1 hypothetical protein [Escherichia coli]